MDASAVTSVRIDGGNVSGSINKRQVAFELAEQMKDALEGVAEQAVEIMRTDGIDIVDGVSVGVRAGKMAEAMARANTARRVRDLDGYRRALRTAGAYIMGALLEIGEPIRLPSGIDPWTFRQTAPKFRDTTAYQALTAERHRSREIEADRQRMTEAARRHTLAAGTGDEIEDSQAEQLERFKAVLGDIAALAPTIGTIDDSVDVKNCPSRPVGYPDVICDKGAGHPGPCHPLITTVRVQAPHVRTDYPGAIPHNDPTEQVSD